MKIDPKDYMTVSEAMKAIGCSKRCLYRILDRVGRESVFVEMFGKKLIPRAKLQILKAHYYPYYSDAHQAMVREWGRQGGATKAANAARKTTRSRADGNGSACEQA